MELMTRKEALTLKLHERESVLHDRELSPVEPQYCIVWEDPTKLDDPVKVTVPSPEWLAMAMHGNILPPVDVWPISIDENGNAIIPDSYHNDVIGPQSEEDAMEYLLQKDVPSRVWADDTSNTPRYYICKRTMIPTNSEWRNAWRINKELEMQ